MIRPTTMQAYRFFHEATKAFAEMEHHGIRIDTKYLDRAIENTAKEIATKEKELKQTPIYATWRKRFKEPNLDSTTQFAEVLFGVLGHKITHRTATGKAKADERALEEINIPFVKDFLACKKLRKALGTYLKGIKREVMDGYLHPSYNLAGGIEDDRKGGAKSYRGSASDPNFQNMPIRNKTMGKLIRSCFIARPGCFLGEIDFSTIEVRIAACVTKDPVLIDYVKDKSKDMHRDRACELFFLKPDQVEKKGPRDAAKNKFVFPQFYGSYYVDCARNIWEMMERNEYTLKDSDVLVKDHLAKHGIKSLGKCDEKVPPRPGTFEHHVKKVEDHMWNEVFKEYTAWKKRWFSKYLRTGEVPMPTGFTATGIYRRNQVLNLPIQGPAFHCLAWSIIQLTKEFRRRKMKSKVIGQIHDCVLIDIHESEVQQVLDLAKEIMTERLPEAWPWLIVPLEVEVDLVPNGKSWNDKEPWVQDEDAVWQLKV